MNVKSPLRQFLSQSAYLGVVPSPVSLRPQGVSAMTLAKNEEDWIETSIISVMNVDDPENFLYTFSPWLRYREAGRWEELHVPWFYAKQTWPEHYYFHMRSVKSGIRLLQKVYQGHWFQARGTGRDVSLEEFVHERV